MSSDRGHHRRAVLLFGLVAAPLAGCSSMPRMDDPLAVPSIHVGEARIWFYREFDPVDSQRVARVTINGGAPISVNPDGSTTYRDVAPGRYQVALADNAVSSALGPLITLQGGQEAFVKVTVLGGWTAVGGGDHFGAGSFGLDLIPAETARKDMARHRFAGAS